MPSRREDIDVHFQSAEAMPHVSSNAARMAIAGPPLTNRIDGESLDKAEYLTFLSRVFSEVERALVNGGVLAMVNTDLRDHNRYNQGKSGFDGQVWYKHADLRQVAERVGFRCFDVRIWVKSLKRNQY